MKLTVARDLRGAVLVVERQSSNYRRRREGRRSSSATYHGPVFIFKNPKIKPSTRPNLTSEVIKTPLRGAGVGGHESAHVRVATPQEVEAKSWLRTSPAVCGSSTPGGSTPVAGGLVGEKTVVGQRGASRDAPSRKRVKHK